MKIAIAILLLISVSCISATEYQDDHAVFA